MRMLLTSAGIRNASIRQALDDMLVKPVSESNALCIPTAGHPFTMAPGMGWRFVSGNEPQCPMVSLDWKSVGLLELTALPTVDPARWKQNVAAADVLLVNGGDALYLHHWMRESGLAELLPELDIVYVGLSAGSMVMTPQIGEEFAEWVQPSGTDEALGVVDFAIFPHLDHPQLPNNTMAHAERWAAKLTVPSYAIDDETAIKVVNGAVEVISEGHWRTFEPGI